jgi:hypothetical protein
VRVQGEGTQEVSEGGRRDDAIAYGEGYKCGPLPQRIIEWIDMTAVKMGGRREDALAYAVCAAYAAKHPLPLPASALHPRIDPVTRQICHGCANGRHDMCIRMASGYKDGRSWMGMCNCKKCFE